MAGPDARPRPDQARAVEHLVEGRRRVLVVQATGWGKSAVYWAATAALRAKGAGPTLVVSPLLALMRDQIAAAERAGLRAATVNSTNVEEWGGVLAALRSGQTDVLLISPERLSNPSFAAQLPELLGQCAYSGQTANRVELEDRLRDNTIKALVATSALGMGYDKPDLAFCVHLGSPASPVAYYQQVGRAGRALEDAQAILVPAESDERIWDYFATSGIPDEQQVERILDALGDSVQSLAGLEAATGIRRGRLEGLLKILAVDDAVRRESGGWGGTGRPWYFDEQKWNTLRDISAAEAGLMRSYAHRDGRLPDAVPVAGAGRSRSGALRPVFGLYRHPAGAGCTSVAGRRRGSTPVLPRNHGSSALVESLFESLESIEPLVSFRL
jgi:superfamily II DNA helicase RecQ